MGGKGGQKVLNEGGIKKEAEEGGDFQGREGIISQS